MADTRALQAALQSLVANGVRGDCRRIVPTLETLFEGADGKDVDRLNTLVRDVCSLVRNASDEVSDLRRRVREPWRCL